MSVSGPWLSPAPRAVDTTRAATRRPAGPAGAAPRRRIARKRVWFS